MTDPIKICSVAGLENNRSRKFTLPEKSRFPREGFLIRVDNAFHAYINQCPHVPIPLDFDDNDFFSIDLKTLVCKNHGAEFDPKTGLCTLGPCAGKSLKKIALIIENEEAYMVDHSLLLANES